MRKYPPSFKFDDIDQDNFSDQMLNYITEKKLDTHFYKLIYDKLFNYDIYETSDLFFELMKILFRIGIIGIRLDGYDYTHWSHEGHKISGHAIDENSVFSIHPAFHRVLGVTYR
jgi:hypothetical protein